MDSRREMNEFFTALRNGDLDVFYEYVNSMGDNPDQYLDWLRALKAHGVRDNDVNKAIEAYEKMVQAYEDFQGAHMQLEDRVQDFKRSLTPEVKKAVEKITPIEGNVPNEKKMEWQFKVLKFGVEIAARDKLLSLCAPLVSIGKIVVKLRVRENKALIAEKKASGPAGGGEASRQAVRSDRPPCPQAKSEGLSLPLRIVGGQATPQPSLSVRKPGRPSPQDIKARSEAKGKKAYPEGKGEEAEPDKTVIAAPSDYSLD